MRVLVYSRHPDAQPNAGIQFVDAGTLFAQSDVLSLHCPLTDETRHLINRESLTRMKDGAMLINTARGPLIDEAALREALCSGKLTGAAVDVADSEPIPRRLPAAGRAELHHHAAHRLGAAGHPPPAARDRRAECCGVYPR